MGYTRFYLGPYLGGPYPSDNGETGWPYWDGASEPLTRYADKDQLTVNNSNYEQLDAAGRHNDDTPSSVCIHNESGHLAQWYTWKVITPVVLDGTATCHVHARYYGVTPGYFEEVQLRFCIGKRTVAGVESTIATGSWQNLTSSLAAYNLTATLSSDSIAQGELVFFYFQMRSYGQIDDITWFVYCDSGYERYVDLPDELNIYDASSSKSLLWNVQTNVAVNTTIHWMTYENIEKDVDIQWHTPAGVGLSVETLWDTESNLYPVEKDADIKWMTIESIEKDIDAQWNTMVGVMQSMVRISMEAQPYTELSLTATPHTALILEEVA